MKVTNLDPSSVDYWPFPPEQPPPRKGWLKRKLCWHLDADLRVEPLSGVFLSYRCPDCGESLSDPRREAQKKSRTI